METTVKKEFPPNIEDIRAALPLSGNEIFAYDKVIYHPGGGHLTAPLIAHEKVHFAQQGDDPAGWWERYLRDPKFRYEQELQAHREELRVFCRLTKDRNAHWRYCKGLTGRMQSPMYGIRHPYFQLLKELRAGIF